MDRLTDVFERVVEKFLSGNLNRRGKILSWLTLILLAFSLWGGIQLSAYPIRVKDAETGRERTVPLKELLLHRDH